MFMQTPVGAIKIRQSKIKEAESYQTKEELFAACDGRFVDPELLWYIINKGMYAEFEQWSNKEEKNPYQMIPVEKFLKK